MWAWGVNSDGLLGDGTTTSQQFPVQTLLHDVTEVSQGYLQTMALQKMEICKPGEIIQVDFSEMVH